MKKNILLIGGSYGIGLSIVKQLQETHTIYVASRSADGLKDLNVEYIQFDALTDSLNTEQLPEELHGFVYCPGSINLKPLKMLSMANFEEDMQLNFFSMVRVVKDIIGRMAAETPLSIQLGGGIRSEQALAGWFEAGVTRCVIGSLAVTDPDAVRAWLARGSIRSVV